MILRGDHRGDFLGAAGFSTSQGSDDGRSAVTGEIPPALPQLRQPRGGPRRRAQFRHRHLPDPRRHPRSQPQPVRRHRHLHAPAGHRHRRRRIDGARSRGPVRPAPPGPGVPRAAPDRPEHAAAQADARRSGDGPAAVPRALRGRRVPGVPLHRLRPVLRPGLPCRHASRVHRLPAVGARPRRVRVLPHRSRGRVVRPLQALRLLPDLLGDVQQVPAPDPHADPQPAPGPADLRAVPLARQVLGRAARDARPLRL